MSSHLVKCLGYAMPWHEFEAITTLDCEAHLTEDTLYNIFEKLDDADLTVDRETYKELFYHSKAPSIMETRLLSKTYTDGDRVPVDIGDASDLFETIQGCDEDYPTHVIFFPSLRHREDWCRYSNTIDYEFERWLDGSDRYYNPEPRDIIKYVPYGIDVYRNYLMLEDGTPQEWLHFTELRERKDIVPAVPSEIRWYLNKFGIMDNQGVNKLRPIIAQWWT